MKQHPVVKVLFSDDHGQFADFSIKSVGEPIGERVSLIDQGSFTGNDQLCGLSHVVCLLMEDIENIKEERFTTIKIEDRTAFEDNQLDFWECECKEEPAYMYNVDGEYRKTLVEFWNHYNQFPLKVVHTRVWDMDDNQDYDKVYKLRIDVIQSIQELNQMLDEVGWKLVDETFFITNSSKPIQLKTYPVVWSRKLMGEKPVFELGPGYTLTEFILHGNSFLIGTQDHSLYQKTG